MIETIVVFSTVSARPLACCRRALPVGLRRRSPELAQPDQSWVIDVSPSGGLGDKRTTEHFNFLRSQTESRGRNVPLRQADSVYEGYRTPCRRMGLVPSARTDMQPPQTDQNHPALCLHRTILSSFDRKHAGRSRSYTPILHSPPCRKT
jgi:hypothetical protein